MDRTIPHIRNIFSSAPSSRKKSTSDTQDLCLYEKSPRNRHRNKTSCSSSQQDADFYQHDSPPKKKNDPGKENMKSKMADESRYEERKSSNRNNYNTYSSKTLTERDMRHLERHLSMKKTIRKQISRNLAQAFLDNPNLFEPETGKPEPEKPEATRPKKRADNRIIANSEQNVLDLLKISIEDRDSGHSSPTHEHQDDTDYDEDDAAEVRGWSSSMKPHRRSSETKGLVVVDDRPKQHHQEFSGEKKSSSIWKMFSSRNKSKR